MQGKKATCTEAPPLSPPCLPSPPTLAASKCRKGTERGCISCTSPQHLGPRVTHSSPLCVLRHTLTTGPPGALDFVCLQTLPCLGQPGSGSAWLDASCCAGASSSPSPSPLSCTRQSFQVGTCCFFLLKTFSFFVYSIYFM